MRRIISSILILATGIVLLNSCEKVDVPQDVNTLGKGSYVKLDKSISSIIDFSNLTTSKVAIDVSEYGADQEKLTIFVAPGTPSQDKTKWKKVKEVPNDNNGIYNLSVSGTEIATAIAPVAIAPGNQYTLYNVITTKDGRTFDFSNTNTGFSGNPNYNMAMTWPATVVCPFIGPIGGKYIVVQDDWVDWSPGAEVDVTDGPGANQVNISKVWPNPKYTMLSPLIINVNPATGAATIPANVVWGRYPDATYGTIDMSTTTPNTGYVFSCTGQIIMNIRLSATNYGDQGSFNLILKKK